MVDCQQSGFVIRCPREHDDGRFGHDFPKGLQCWKSLRIRKPEIQQCDVESAMLRQCSGTGETRAGFDIELRAT